MELNESRSALAEYARFAGTKAEIQIRSILQHAWAEIEHDLGYKTKLGVPRDIRREFSRIAGLLEIADVEFTRVREALRTYEGEVSARIETAPADVLLDAASLTSFLSSSSLIRSLGEELAQAQSTEYVGTLDPRTVEGIVGGLAELGIETVAQLQDEYGRAQAQALPFHRALLTAMELPQDSSRGIPIKGTMPAVLLSYVIAGARNDSALVRRMLTELRPGVPDEFLDRLVNGIIAAHAALKAPPSE